MLTLFCIHTAKSVCVQQTNDLDVDFVIYTFDRPMQVYALLESAEKYLQGLGEAFVICRASSKKLYEAYKKVESRFHWAKFLYQGNKPHQDFKPLMIKAAFQSPNKYLMFGVDDIIIKDFIDLHFCTQKLEETGAYGFYLRLGKNINRCYSEKKITPVPPHTKICDDVYAWTFKDGAGDWRYPNSNDMTVYRKNDIKGDLESLKITSTAYEGPWASKAIFNKKGLFFTESKIVNIPLNIVNEEYRKNRHMHSFDALELLEMFNNGLKIDISRFYQIKNQSPHEEIDITFIKI